jgi:hypothetical protein
VKPAVIIVAVGFLGGVSMLGGPAAGLLAVGLAVCGYVLACMDELERLFAENGERREGST